MLSVDQVKNFSPVAWEGYQQHFVSMGMSLAQEASALQAAAAGMKWSDRTGELVKLNIEKQASHALDAAKQCFEAAEVIDAAARMMVAIQNELINLLAHCTTQRLIVLPNGWVLPEPAYALTHPTEVPELVKRAAQMAGLIKVVLQQATDVDGKTANALAAMGNLNLPYVDGGPIDFSDDDIKRQADNHNQGPLGHCAFLSPLMSIGRADPEFIRRNCVWDEATQKYKVTLHDPNTGQPVTVWVDPRNLDPDTGKAKGSQDPDYITIFQQAVIQQYPHDSFNFELTQKIILGHATPESDSSQTSFQDIRSAMSTQPPAAVMVATPGAQKEGDDTVPIVPGHAYSVKGFDEQGRIILMNPWGGDGHIDGQTRTYPQELHLTEEQYRQYVHGVTVAKPPF